jgi:hypothetical protein
MARLGVLHTEKLAPETLVKEKPKFELPELANSTNLGGTIVEVENTSSAPVEVPITLLAFSRK